MENKLPVVFLSFANIPSNPLPSLVEEEDKLKRILTPKANKQFLQLHSESNANASNIPDFLTGFDNRVVIFHYGGHAESQKLLLTDQEVNGKGLAEMISLQKGLRLVFLNGCATLDQVDALLKLEVPVVVATSTEVNDHQAKEFAIQFYRGLSEGHSILQSFMMARAELTFKAGDQEIPIELHRAIGKIKREEIVREDAPQEFPWGLYYTEDEDLQWTLPQEVTTITPVRSNPNMGIGQQQNFQLNSVLTDVLANALQEFNPEMREIVREGNGNNNHLRLIRRGIVDCLPAPLGEQVRQLFAIGGNQDGISYNKPNFHRLKQLVKTYRVLVELMNFIMIAQLWECQHCTNETTISEDLKEKIRTFLKMQPHESPQFNYHDMVSGIHQHLSDNNVDYFLDELDKLSELFKKNEAYKEAHQFFETLRTNMLDGSKQVQIQEHIQEYCLKAESNLGELLKHLGFCARYTFFTIKNIELVKIRHQKEEYLHATVPLHTITAGYSDDPLPMKDFSENNSVILVKPHESSNGDRESLSENLNLSPFVIDENALEREQGSRLFFYSHYEEDKAIDKQDFVFKYVQDFETTFRVNKYNYPNIVQQFDNFAQLIFNKKFSEI